MPEEDAMLKDVANKAALAMISVAVLGSGLSRAQAQESGRPAVRSQMLVSTDWLEQHLNDRNLVVLYVGRDRSQFESGHIPGSRFVRLDDVVEQHKDSLNELPPIADLQAAFESLGLGDRVASSADRRCPGYSGGTGLLHARLPWPRRQCVPSGRGHGKMDG